MSKSAILDNIVRPMSAAARQAVLADPVLQEKLVQVYKQYPDRRGYRGEVRCLPTLEWSRGKLRGR